MRVTCCSPAPSLRPRQPQPEALFERVSIREVCQGNILRHEAGGVDQYALVVVLPAALLACDHFCAKALLVSGRRDVQRTSSNLYIVVRQRNALVPMLPMPTRPRTRGWRGPTHLQAIVAAAVLRMA